MKLHKCLKFRIMPTAHQEGCLARIAGSRRFVWNWALARWREYYKETGRSIPISQLSRELTELKKQAETSWLNESPSHSLQQSLRDLQNSFTAFFRGQSKYPKFKSKKRERPKFRIYRDCKFTNSTIYIPKVGNVRIRNSHEFTGPAKCSSFSRLPNGHWHVTVLVEFEILDNNLPQPNPSNTVGIDVGLKDFVVTSNDERTLTPKFYRSSERKIQRAQKILSRRKKGSKRREKARLTVARIHQKVSNQRGDFLHKLTSQLIRNHDAIYIEDLNVKGLAKTKLAKSFYDASIGEFRRQLEYKSTWNRKHLVVIDRFFPSSKMCSQCGSINEELTLKDRTWVCGCGVTHDRDLNAAINIRNEGIRTLAAGYAESLNAHGVRVSPAKAGPGRRSENGAN